MEEPPDVVIGLVKNTTTLTESLEKPASLTGGKETWNSSLSTRFPV
jgi:hypothetical protein